MVNILEQTKVAAARSILNDIFKNPETEIKFYKKDKSERVMKVTTNPKVIEEATGKDIDMQSPEENILLESVADPFVRVFDLEKNAWRGFKLDSLFEVDGEHPASVIRRHMLQLFPEFVGTTSK